MEERKEDVMREIKFRAWFVSTKEMVYNYLALNADQNKFIPMQYIGKKDKNGKEIYEDDIIKCVVNGIVTNSVVKMKNGRWIGENKGKAQDDNIFMIKDIEVIGNKFENFELLQKIIGRNVI